MYPNSICFGPNVPISGSTLRPNYILTGTHRKPGCWSVALFASDMYLGSPGKQPLSETVLVISGFCVKISRTVAGFLQPNPSEWTESEWSYHACMHVCVCVYIYIYIYLYLYIYIDIHSFICAKISINMCIYIHITYIHIHIHIADKMLLWCWHVHALHLPNLLRLSASWKFKS